MNQWVGSFLGCKWCSRSRIVAIAVIAVIQKKTKHATDPSNTRHTCQAGMGLERVMNT